MARSGPLTKTPASLALGLAQIRVGSASENIATATPVLTEADSIGSLAQTKFTNEVEYWTHSSGFPALEDQVYPLSESPKLECQFEELTPANLAIAMGKDPSEFSDVHTGTIKLGAMAEPVRIRMEAVYTYPSGKHTMTIVFPMAQVTSATELDFQSSDSIKSPLTFEAKRADSGIEGGNAAWNAMPMGCITFAAVSSASGG